MKIAMFTDAYFPRINGVAISVHSYALELTKLGHDVCVVCLEYTEKQQRNASFDEKKEDLNSPFKIIRIASSALIWSKEDRAARFDKWFYIKKKMDEFSPDVIHVNSEWVVGYYGAMYARHRHVPYVFTFHTLWEDYLANYVNFLPEFSTRLIGRDIVKFYLKRADIIIAPTNHIANVVHDYGIEHEVELLPTGISDSLYEYSEAQANKVNNFMKEKFPTCNFFNKKILLYVGRIVKEKNLRFLYDVLININKTEKDVVLLFVGGGPYQEELEKDAVELGIQDSVFFTGYVAREDLLYFYKMADVFVFPSKTDTQGLVTIEAMLAGLPVVAIGIMGTVDVMQGNHGGFMVDDNVEEFSDKVKLLLNDKLLHDSKSAEAKEWGKQWSMGALTERLVSFYKKAIESKKTAKNSGFLGLVMDNLEKSPFEEGVED